MPTFTFYWGHKQDKLFSSMSMSLPTFDKNKGTCNDREKKEWKNANLLFIKKRRFDSCSRRGTLNLSHWCMAGKSYSAVAVVVPWTWAIDAWREKVIPGHRVRCFRSHCWKSLLTRCCCVLSTLAASCLPRSYSSFQTDGSFLSVFKAFITMLLSLLQWDLHSLPEASLIRRLC